MAVKLLIFDCFGVIRNESAPVWLNRFFNAEEADKIQREIIRPGDRGELSCEETFRKLSEVSGQDKDVILKEWLGYATPKNDTIAMIKELRKDYKIELLSNAIDGLIHTLFTDSELEELFDYTVISCEEGFAKPDPEIFLLALERSGFQAEDAVFTDDNPNNIKAAEALGIRGILFKNAAQFKEELERLT